jgi:hypothetical protein
MASLLTGAVQGCANVACRRFNVTDLEPSETLAIAQSLAGVAAAYDVLGQLNPRTSALLTLGITVAAVTAARRPRELPPSPPAAATPDQNTA